MSENAVEVAFATKARKRASAARAGRLYPTRLARQLALAHALQRRVDSGEFADYADMARALGFTRARITQIMDLLLLAPEIQEEILFLEVAPGARQLSERVVRRRVLSPWWRMQQREWSRLKHSTTDPALPHREGPMLAQITP